MIATAAYRRLRREVHDVLEVGGDAHPMGRVVAKTRCRVYMLGP